MRQSTGGATASPKCEEVGECSPTKRIPTIATTGPVSRVTMTSAVNSRTDQVTTDENGWQLVGKKRPLTKRRVLTGSGKNDDELQTAERVMYMQAWSFKPETTVESVRNYINKIAVCDRYFVEKRDIKTDQHAAFVIGFPESLYDTLCTPNSWPQGVKLSDWFRRSPRSERGSLATAGHSNNTNQ